MKTKEEEKEISTMLGNDLINYIKKNKDNLIKGYESAKEEDKKEIDKYSDLFYENARLIKIHKDRKPPKIFKNKYVKWEKELEILEKENDRLNKLYISKISDYNNNYYIDDK